MTAHDIRSATGSGEHRAWVAALAGVCAPGAVSAVVPVLEHVVGAALIAAVIGSVAAAVIRRELRIRRRLVANTPLHAREIAGRSCPPRLSSQLAASAATSTGGAA